MVLKGGLRRRVQDERYIKDEQLMNYLKCVLLLLTSAFRKRPGTQTLKVR